MNDYSLLNQINVTVHQLSDEMKAVRQEDIPALRVEIATLKAKSFVWGSIAGIIGGGVVYGLFHALAASAYQMSQPNQKSNMAYRIALGVVAGLGVIGSANILPAPWNVVISALITAVGTIYDSPLRPIMKKTLLALSFLPALAFTQAGSPSNYLERVDLLRREPPSR